MLIGFIALLSALVLGGLGIVATAYLRQHPATSVAVVAQTAPITGSATPTIAEPGATPAKTDGSLQTPTLSATALTPTVLLVSPTPQVPISPTFIQSLATPPGSVTLTSVASSTAPAPSATPTPTSAVAAPTPSPTPTSTTTPSPLVIQNDQGCIDTFSNDVYIFGEIRNPTSATYDLDMNVQVFGPEGEISVTGALFDMPGVYFIPPNRVLPFVMIAPIHQPTFTHYNLELDVQPSLHQARDDIRLDEFVTTQDEDAIEVNGKWTNLGDRPLSRFVSIIATAYDAQGRVNNFAYLNIGAQVAVTPGQHSFNDLFLDPSPCGTGIVQVSLLGE